jgi:hypothetical protein
MEGDMLGSVAVISFLCDIQGRDFTMCDVSSLALYTRFERGQLRCYVHCYYYSGHESPL